MFEAIHGSAPRRAGQNIANPSGLINAALMMLVHLGQGDVASLVQNAWLKTIEDGMHTVDVYKENISSKKLSTKEFTAEVISRLGDKPNKFKQVEYNQEKPLVTAKSYDIDLSEIKTLVGVDVTLNWNGNNPSELAEKIKTLVEDSGLGLQMVSVKGLKVWPDNGDLLVNSDEWNLRFVPISQDKVTTHSEIVRLLEVISKANLDFVRINNLYIFNDKLGFSLAQGE